jgi:hypothetical protein
MRKLHNNSLDRSAGSVFFNLSVGIDAVANRRAQSTQPLDSFVVDKKRSGPGLI